MQMVNAPHAVEHQLKDSDFDALARLARREFGLSLAVSKKPLVASRLSRRLRARRLAAFQDYLQLLDNPAEADERLELISALTTNVTSFFREAHHFETLRTEILPELVNRTSTRRRVRLWSAGCSSGQEAFSIAMTLLDAWPEAPQQDVRILATDIDPKIVARARQASYPAADGDTIPARLRRFWTVSGQGGNTQGSDAQGRVSDEVRSLVTFAELNLVGDWPFRGQFDAIFCRNVAIYFDKETQQRLWQRLAERLTPGGLLCIGHSERVTGPALDQLQSQGITSYRKRPAAAAAMAD